MIFCGGRRGGQQIGERMVKDIYVNKNKGYRAIEGITEMRNMECAEVTGIRI